jgi:hypothetical protein
MFVARTRAWPGAVNPSVVVAWVSEACDGLMVGVEGY